MSLPAVAATSTAAQLDELEEAVLAKRPEGEPYFMVNRHGLSSQHMIFIGCSHEAYVC
jgi:hypothetical protein